MSTRNYKQWILAIAMAIGVGGLYGYHTNSVKSEEVCVQQPTKESQDKKVESKLPMWESVARHLIMESRY